MKKLLSITCLLANLAIIGTLHTMASKNLSQGQKFIEDAAQGNLSQVVNYIAQNKDVNAQSPFEIPSRDGGWTALHLATDSDVLKALLAAKTINPNVKDAAGRTPLTWTAQNAAANKILEDKILLLLAKARNLDINSQDWLGNTALHYAAHYGSPKIVQALLEKGALANIKNNKGDDAAEIAAFNNSNEVAKIIRKYYK